MLGVIVGVIVGARAPVYLEVVLGYAVAYPIKPHIHRAGATLAYCVVDYSHSTKIVGLYWCRRLQVAHGL